MKVVGLVSGGKDGCFSLYECILHDHEIVALANMQPPGAENGTVEVDSYMFQSVATEGIRYFANALCLPLYQTKIVGSAICQSLLYSETPSDEVEDLYGLLAEVKLRHPEIEGVASGAILSNYQRERVEDVCERLSLTSLAYLWRRNQKSLLSDMLNAKIDSTIVKIASFGLDIEHFLGARLSDVAPRLVSLADDPAYSLNPCGEGGEFETFTFDCLLFHQSIVPAKPVEVVHHSSDKFAPVAYLEYTGFELKDKDATEIKNTKDDLLALEGSCYFEAGSVDRRPFHTVDEMLSTLPESVPREIQTLSVAAPDEATVSLQTNKISVHSPDEGLFFFSPGIVITRTFIGSCLLSDPENCIDCLEKATLSALAGVRSCLTLANISMDNIVHCNVVTNRLDLSSKELFAAINRPFKSTFDTAALRLRRIGGLPPSRVCLASDWPVDLRSADMPHDRDGTRIVSIGISAIAVVRTHSNGQNMSIVDGMRVRSLSHWAPAAIAPYSQAIRVSLQTADIEIQSASETSCHVFYAGQIGLIPEILQLPPISEEVGTLESCLNVGVIQQGWLALRNMHRVLEVMDKAGWSGLLYAIAYAVDLPSLQCIRSQFHASVCNSGRASELATSDDDHCLCDRRVVWAIISSLPMGASMEWQCVSSSSPPQTTVFPNPNVLEGSCLLLIRKSSLNVDSFYDDLSTSFSEIGQNMKYPIVPVLRFLDSSVTCVSIKIS